MSHAADSDLPMAGRAGWVPPIKIGGAALAVAVVAVVWSGFQLYTGVFGFFHLMIQRPVHVILAVLLGFFMHPLSHAAPRTASGGQRSRARYRYYLAVALNVLLPVLTVISGLYFLLQFDRMTSRIPFVDSVTTLDVVFGVITVLLIMEIARRTMGLAMPILAMLFVAYSFLGPYMPTLLRHRGISVARFVDYQFLTSSGVWGTPTEVSVSTVFYFVLFAAFLQQSGGGKLFIDMATVLTARTRGGAAKAAVVASSLFGTISGSSTANVVGTGIFTIPLMKRIGYPAAFAGAVEAAASTGGQIMPPIMGAAAFIVAQFLGVTYATVALAALLPAILYYLSIFVLVDLKAQKEHLKGLGAEEIKDIRSSFWKRAHLLIPIAVLIYFIFAGYTLAGAAIRSMAVAVLVSFLRKETRMGVRDIFLALVDGAKGAVTVAIPCALAGVIIGSLVQTGLSLKFTGLIVLLSGGFLLLALVFTMAGEIVLGMGMPTTAAYIMGAVLLVPTLVDMGVSPLAAHLFVLYFGSLSMITPPVAISSYAAAGIAQAGLNETSWTAFRLVLVAFLVPFAFVYNPAMILEGTPVEIAWVAVTSTIGIFPLAGFILGYFWGRGLATWERLVMLASALLLITPEPITDLAGLAILGLWMAGERMRLGRRRRLAAEQSASVADSHSASSG